MLKDPNPASLPTRTTVSFKRRLVRRLFSPIVVIPVVVLATVVIACLFITGLSSRVVSTTF